MRALESQQRERARHALARASARDLGPETHSALALLCLFDPDATHAERTAVHQSWADRFAASESPAPRGNQPARIAYLYHRRAPTADSDRILPLLRAHDRARFVVFGYGCEGGDVYRSTEGLTAGDIAATIRADGIDILFDADGHFDSRSMEVFAARPAPLLVSLGSYPFPRGLPDALHLPDPLVYQPPRFSPPPRATGAYHANGFITFGCLSPPVAIGPKLLGAFAALLANAGDSRIVFLLPHGVRQPAAVASRLRQDFEALGVDGGRVAIAGPLAAWDRFDLLNSVDILLGAAPFNDAVATMDGLWMGVPSVVCDDGAEPGRGSATVLRCCGLEDLVAKHPDDMQAITENTTRLLISRPDLRRELASRFRQSPFLNYEAACRSVEHTVAEALRHISE